MNASFVGFPLDAIGRAKHDGEAGSSSPDSELKLKALCSLNLNSDRRGLETTQLLSVTKFLKFASFHPAVGTCTSAHMYFGSGQVV